MQSLGTLLLLASTAVHNATIVPPEARPEPTPSYDRLRCGIDFESFRIAANVLGQDLSPSIQGRELTFELHGCGGTHSRLIFGPSTETGAIFCVNPALNAVVGDAELWGLCYIEVGIGHENAVYIYPIDANHNGVIADDTGKVVHGEGSWMACNNRATLDWLDVSNDVQVLAYKAPDQKTLAECVDVELVLRK
jgi:hypothetical protein